MFTQWTKRYKAWRAKREWSRLPKSLGVPASVIDNAWQVTNHPDYPSKFWWLKPWHGQYEWYYLCQIIPAMTEHLTNSEIYWAMKGIITQPTQMDRMVCINQMIEQYNNPSFQYATTVTAWP
jgi:hypothetical protein